MRNHVVEPVFLGVEHEHLEIREAGDDALLLCRQHLLELCRRDDAGMELVKLRAEKRELLLSTTLDRLFLPRNDLEAARDELVFEESDLFLHAKVDARVHLQQHVRDGLSDLPVLAVHGDLPEDADAHHLVGSHLRAHLDQLCIDLSVVDRAFLPLLEGCARGGLGDVVVLDDKFLGPEIHQEEEHLDAMVALDVDVCEVVVFLADGLGVETLHVLILHHAGIPAQKEVVAHDLQPVGDCIVILGDGIQGDHLGPDLGNLLRFKHDRAVLGQVLHELHTRCHLLRVREELLEYMRPEAALGAQGSELLPHNSQIVAELADQQLDESVLSLQLVDKRGPREAALADKQLHELGSD